MSRRMTVGQAFVEFLGHQWTVDGGARERSIAGVFGILGHGNVAGVGQAIAQANWRDPRFLPFHQARSEQAMVHQAVGYARMRRRRSTFACTSSIGPGAANMLTGAALATANHLPVLLLPSDAFATRVSDPVLQQLEIPHDTSLQVTDAFRPLSRYFDRVDRPEKLFSIALGAMRVLLDPVETGAVTIALPEDVQTESIEVPDSFLEDRDWHLRRPPAEDGAIARAADAIRSARAPFIVAGGGVLYSGAEHTLRDFVERTGIPVGTTQAGTGVLPWDNPQNVGGVGATGTAAANHLARMADVVIGIGTRYSDFTTASRTAFQNPDVKFININVAAFDAYKHGTQLAVIADAREALRSLALALEGYSVGVEFAARVAREKTAWDQLADRAMAPTRNVLPGQPEIIGVVQQAMDPRDVLVQAAGSLPGDLHRLWRVRDAMGYHVEYGFSCMGYEIAGGLGVRRGAPDRDVVVLVGDGSYLMLHTELVTAVAEGIKIIVVIVQNQGYASIGYLSESLGTRRFGTQYRQMNPDRLDFEGDTLLPVDLAANARSYGLDVIEVKPTADAVGDLRAAIARAKASDRSTVIHINSDPLVYAPDNGSWWDVPVAEVSDDGAVQSARADYVENKSRQKPLVG